MRIQSVGVFLTNRPVLNLLAVVIIAHTFGYETLAKKPGPETIPVVEEAGLVTVQLSQKIRQARKFLEQSKFDQAENLLGQILGLNPDPATEALARQMLADVLCYTRQYERAAAELERAISLGRLSGAKEFYAYVELIRLKIKLFDYDAAPDLLAQVEQKFLGPTSPMYTDPDNFPPVDRSYFILSEMLWNSGMPEEALKYASVVAGFQTSRGREATLIAAQALEAMGQTDPALSLLEQATGEYEDENPKILARVYYALIKMALKHKAPSVAISLAEEGRNRFEGKMAANYSYHVAQLLQKALNGGGREYLEAVAASEFEGVRIGALDKLIGMALEQKQWAKVEAYCLRVLSLADCPSNRYLENSLVLMTALAMQEKDISVVLESLLNYTQKKGNSKDGYSTYRIAKELEKLGRKDKAKSLYNGILKKGWKEEWAGRSAFQMVDLYVQNGQIQEAADLLADFIIYQEKGDNRKEAVRGITKLLEIPDIENIQNPAQLIHAMEDNLAAIQDPDLLLNLAALLSNRKMTGQARKCVDMALTLANTTLENLTPQERIAQETLICRRLYELGDFNTLMVRIDAISSEIFNDPLVKLEEYAELKFYHGFALWSSGHEEEAAAGFEHILGLLAGNKDFYPNIAVNIAILYREANEEKYQDLIESAILLSPSSFGASLGRIWLGIDALLANDLDAADACAQAILANSSPSSEIEWTRDLYWNGLFLEGYVLAARQAVDGEGKMKKAVSRGNIMGQLKSLAETRWPASVVPDTEVAADDSDDPSETGGGSKGGGSSVPHPPPCSCTLSLTLSQPYLGIDMVEPRCEHISFITATAAYTSYQSCTPTYTWSLESSHAQITDSSSPSMRELTDICEPSSSHGEEIIRVTGCCCENYLQFTAVQVDVSLGEGEDTEEDPGSCVFLNNDDDNENMIIDYNEQPMNPVVADDDLTAFSISIAPDDLPGDQIVNLSGSGMEFCYEDQEKQIPASETYMVSELPKTLYVEGKQPGIYSLEVDHELSGAIDKAIFRVPKLDLDIDSDHTSDFGGPQQNCDLEDLIEAGTTNELYRGLKYVVVNEYHDADTSGIPGYADGFDLDNQQGSPDDQYTPAFPAASPVMIPLNLSIANLYPDPDQTEITFIYPGESSVGVDIGQQEGETVYYSSGSMRLWSRLNLRDKRSVVNGGSYLPPGEWIPLTNCSPNTIYLEGLSPSSGLEGGSVEISVRNTPSGWPAMSDIVKLSIIRVDVDIDSNNNNGFDEPSRNLAEDHYEDIEGDPSRPGKIMAVNDNDDDRDGIPDFADGFDLLPDNTNDDVNISEQFVPVVFELPAPIDPTTARVAIHYTGESDPREVTVDEEGLYHCGPGQMRLWTKPGNVARGSAAIDAGGDFIPAGNYSAEAFGFTNGIQTLTLYLEAVGPSSEIAAHRIVFSVDPNGDTKNPPGYLAADALRVTILKIDMAMDGNRDDTIAFDDPEDAEYLFWVNNDYDVKHQNEGIWQQDDDDPAGNPDCNDNYIGNVENSSSGTCERDLEDFTRLHMRVDDNTATMSGITYWLKFENVTSGSPSVNVFEAVDTSSDYLSDSGVAAQQIQKQNLTQSGVGTTEVQIDAQYIKTDNQVSPFIIEGRSAGKGDLTFIVKKDGNEICKKAVTIELHDMPWFYDVYSVAVSSGIRWEVQIPTTATHSQTASYSPATSEKFLLVHGWNMNAAEKTQWIQTVFKRLWWQGYQGSVALFDWPTLSDMNFWDVLAGAHHFDNSEFRSWLSADALIGVFNALNGGGNLRVLAHSMGNVVTGEALRRYTGANLHTYLACQAALSAHFYDNTIAANHPCQHQGYDLFFPNTPDIMGHFSTGDGNSNPHMTDNDTHVSNMQNYFNPDDWALDWWEVNNVLKPDGLTPYLFGYDGSEDHYQEGTDQFSRGPIDNPYEVLSVTNQRQRYMIFSYCDESRSRALGQTANAEFNDWDLQANMGYDDQHYSHSREFRSNIADEWDFWFRVFGTCQFQSP